MSFHIFVFGLVYVGLVLWHINHCRLFEAKSSLYIYIKYKISKHISSITFLNESKLIFLHTIKWFLSNTINSIYFYPFVCTQLNVFKYLTLTIQLDSYFLHTIKWLNSSISSNPASHKSFVCSQFKCQGTQFKCETVLFDP